MASTSAEMLLRLWDQLSDLYSHDLLAKNFRKIDAHDHSTDRGVQIPTAGFVDGAVTFEKLAPGVGDTAWKKVQTGDSQSASIGPGTFTLGDGPNYGATTDGVFYFNPADWGVTAGQEGKMKIVSMITTQTTVSNLIFTHGLYPVSFASGTVSYGVRIGGVNVFSPPHDSNAIKTSSVLIPVPAEGLYTLAMDISEYNSGSSVWNKARLMVRR